MEGVCNTWMQWKGPQWQILRTNDLGDIWFYVLITLILVLNGQILF